MKKTRRFKSHVRAQVAALPVRATDAGVDVLLVTSRDSRRWIVPKGWPMNGLEDYDAAATKAWEEAGIKGKIHNRPLGAYTYDKKLPDRIEPCRVMVYRLDVEEEHDTFRESGQRERRRFPQAEAAARVEEPRLAAMIASLES